MLKTAERKLDDLALAAKLRLERWLLSPGLREHMQRAREVKKPTATGAYLTVSREAGSSGTELARLIGQRLGWDVLDKELLDFMTERYRMPHEMLEAVDETRANWVHDMLGSFFDARVVSHDNYVVHLERIVHLAALHGNVVFIGRGAQAFLPRSHGLAVRVIAPRKQRVDHIMQRHNLSHERAAALINEVDSARRQFCERHFHHDPASAEEYDLLINMGRMTLDEAADAVIAALRKRCQGGTAPAAA